MPPKKEIAEDPETPVEQLEDEIAAKEPEDKTAQEEVIEAQAELQQRDEEIHGDSSNVDDEDLPELNPDDLEDDLMIEEGADVVGGEEVPFEPENDPAAEFHGTHDAAVSGLQTDVSGSYTPPGIAKQRQDEAAERANQYRLQDAQDQAASLRHDNSKRSSSTFGG